MKNLLVVCAPKLCASVLILTALLVSMSGSLDPAEASANEIVLYASEAPVKGGRWQVVTDSSAAGGARLRNQDAGAPKLATPLGSPADYFEMTFDANAGQSYRLW